MSDTEKLDYSDEDDVDLEMLALSLPWISPREDNDDYEVAEGGLYIPSEALKKELGPVLDKYVMHGKSVYHRGSNSIYSGFLKGSSAPLTQVIVKKIRHQWYGEPYEITALKKLTRADNCDYVCKVLDFYEDDEFHYIVMDNSPCKMELYNYMTINHRDGIKDVSVATRIFTNVVVAVYNLFFDHSIVHGDIKDENILINTETYEIELIDFGSAYEAASLNELTCQKRGTYEYYPPELFRDDQYRIHAGIVFSLGTLYYCLLTGIAPFHTVENLINWKGDWLYITHDDDGWYDSDEKRQALEIIKNCINIHPKKRYKLQDLYDVMKEMMREGGPTTTSTTRSKSGIRYIIDMCCSSSTKGERRHST